MSTPLPVRQLLDGVLEAVGQHHIGCACGLGDFDLVLGADDRDGPRRTPYRRQAQCRRSDAARCAVHQHGLAVGQPAAGTQRVMHGEVVEQQARACLERHVVGQLEHSFRLQRNDFGHRPVQHRQPGDPVALREAAVGRRAADHARDLGARHEGQLRLVLIEPAGLQGVGKRHPGRVDVDDDRVLVGGLVQLDEFRGMGTVEAGYLNCAHRPI